MQKILILGGGTAGWMAANMLHHYLGKTQQWQITLVESPQIGIIGVGEGSTPQLKKLFDLLGIEESQWMPACNATFKNGIRFLNWSEHQQNNQYFHPFPSPFDRQTATAFLYHCQMRAKGMDVPVHPQDFFLSAQLAKLNLSPKSAAGKPQIPLNYAYHFDSAKLGQYLQKIAIKSGVLHVSGTMQSSTIQSSALASSESHGAKGRSERTNEDEKTLQSITLQTGEVLAADIFIDATGFKSLLLQGAMGVPFESFDSNLFNNKAVAIATDMQSPLPSDTKASALSAGWAWQIPLIGRTGNGYVYCDRYLSEQQAEDELRAHLGLKHTDIPAKHLSMKVGQVTKHWYSNVVGIGLSQGFIEPLEATALHLVHETIEKFAESMLSPRFQTQKSLIKEAFNEEITRRFNGVRDYIVCHYKMNTRTDSNYWKDNRENNDISIQLADVIETWRTGGDISPVLQKHKMTQYYPVISWYCLLAGYGAFKPITSENKLPKGNMKQLAQFLMRSTSSFAPHDVALHIDGANLKR